MSVCQADVKSVVRPKTPDDVERHGGKLPDKTLWAIYYALAAFWIINGVVGLVQALQPRKFMGETIGPGIFDYVSAGFAGITIIVGIGLLARIEIIRGFVNFISALNILFGILGLVSALGSMLVFGALGLLFVISNLVQIIVSGGTIWIIGETQSHVSDI